MATIVENLANSLDELRKIQDAGKVAIRARDLSRTHRERLLKNGFLKEVLKGWFILSSPGQKDGDSTGWYASYWDFCTQYLDYRFKGDWVVSPEQSLLLHGGNCSIPAQLLVRTKATTNKIVTLPFHTSLFLVKAELPPSEKRTDYRGIHLYGLVPALVQASPNAYLRDAVDIRTALLQIRDASDILAPLLEGGQSTIAGRLAGAFRNIGKDRIADTILSTMRDVGYDVRETDPFEGKMALSLDPHESSPYCIRIRLMWEAMRNDVVEIFPGAPGIPENSNEYMREVNAIYVTDAYHSLSIERYQVTTALIERVRSGKWDGKNNAEDANARDAMAARGYWEAFQSVSDSVKKILNGENAGMVVDADHGAWYRRLFAPSVAVGLLQVSDLAGYRSHQVYIGNSQHVPLNTDAVRDAMPVLMALLQREPHAGVRAVLGHFVFVFIHPYMDGNGRMARFLMNAMLASGGYPWTVIPVEKRAQYMKALEQASVGQNIVPFAKFIADLVRKGMDGNPEAGLKQAE